MKIAFRVDGGSIIGMGHIMRTLVLAQELSKANEIVYVCKDKDIFQAGIKKIQSNGFKVIKISEDNMIESLRKINADCLITDSYDVNEEYFNVAKNIFKYTGYIDDNNLISFNVDFIINQNVYAPQLNYIANKNTKLFLGTRYVLLREEFQKAKAICIREKVKNILITVGGGDPYNVTEKILNLVYKLPYNFHVVIGPSFSDITNIQKMVNVNSNVILYHNANMYDLMQKCDLSVSACGSTIYELCACGIPTIGIIIAENQENIAKYSGELGVIYNLGWYSEEKFQGLDKIIEGISNNYDGRRDMSQKQLKIVNKEGVKELSSLINKIF